MQRVLIFIIFVIFIISPLNYFHYFQYLLAELNSHDFPFCHGSECLIVSRMNRAFSLWKLTLGESTIDEGSELGGTTAPAWV
jgi:hypothetical protein